MTIFYYIRTSRNQLPRNAKTEWSPTGGGRLQESNHWGTPPKRGPDTSTFWEIIKIKMSKVRHV